MRDAKFLNKLYIPLLSNYVGKSEVEVTNLILLIVITRSKTCIPTNSIHI